MTALQTEHEVSQRLIAVDERLPRRRHLFWFTGVGRFPEVVCSFDKRRLALIAEFRKKIHQSGYKIRKRAPGFEPEGIEEMFLSEFGLLIKRDRITISEKLTYVVGIG